MANHRNRLVSFHLHVTDPGDFDIGSDFVDSNIGAVLEDRYLLVRTIGSGGMGIVYEAQHTQVRSRHAIKILHKHLMQRQDVVRRFLNEARAAGSLGHPNIVRSTDMGKTPEGIPFVVFEYLDGVTLKEEMVDTGLMPVGRILDIVVQVVSALEAAHQKKIIHRDVKPENIFLLRATSGREQVKLLDFGIAKFVTNTTTLTSDGKIFGSPQYMSPEQLKDAANVDGRTDVYAVGVLLYELLAGRAPFAGQEAMSMVARMRGGVPSLASVAPDVPPSLVRIVDRALSLDPDARHEDMAELRRELETFRSELESGVAHRRPNRWFAPARLLAMAAVLIVVGVGVWLATRGGQEPAGPPAVAAPAAKPAAPPPAPAPPEPKAPDAAVAAEAPAEPSEEAPRPAVRKVRRTRTTRTPVQAPPSGDGPPMFTAPPQ